MRRHDIERKLFYCGVAVASLIGAFTLGMYSGVTENRLYSIVKRIVSDVDKTVEEGTNLLKPIHFLQPARYPGQGVTVNDMGDENGELILISGFFKDDNGIRLLERNGEIVMEWPVKFSDIFPDDSHLDDPPATNWNIDLHGILALPDGSLLFNFEYGGLVKMDRCGTVLWTLRRATHHSVEPAASGGFWVPGRRTHPKGKMSPFPPFPTPFEEDTILEINTDGEILREISVPGLFYANGLETLLTATGESIHPNAKWDEELLHLNSVSEMRHNLAQDFPMFETGDLLLSLRKNNMLMVIDPDTHKIKWWQIGPWKRQHDPQFISGGKITLFNNNTYLDAYGEDRFGVTGVHVPRISNIMELDISTGESSIVFGGKPGQEMLSVVRGKLELTPKGGYLVTEFDGGRVFEIDDSGRLLWEYINRFDNNLVAEISEARIYSEDYFTVDDWSCSESPMN